MKKILLTLFVVCIASGVFAQLSGGIKAGLNLSSLNQKSDDADVDESDGGTSFHVGGYVTIAAGDAISIQPELLYNSIDVDGDKLNYLSVPVMLLYGFADNKFNVQVGPQLGLLLSTDPSEIKDDDIVTGTDFSVNVGAGANFGKLNATLRYCIGLGNIAGSALTDIVDDYKMKTGNFQISIGYKLFGE